MSVHTCVCVCVFVILLASIVCVFSLHINVRIYIRCRTDDMLPNQRESFHYCQPIGLSADLIDILKQFTKAAIRFQPNDVLAWAVA